MARDPDGTADGVAEVVVAQRGLHWGGKVWGVAIGTQRPERVALHGVVTNVLIRTAMEITSAAFDRDRNRHAGSSTVARVIAGSNVAELLQRVRRDVHKVVATTAVVLVVHAVNKVVGRVRTNTVHRLTVSGDAERAEQRKAAGHRLRDARLQRHQLDVITSIQLDLRRFCARD